MPGADTGFFKGGTFITTTPWGGGTISKSYYKVGVGLQKGVGVGGVLLTI